MPIYDYQCPSCSLVFEIHHTMSDTSDKLCTSCNTKMNKLVSVAYLASKGFKPTLEDLREVEHKKKTSDLDRALKMRRKAFGRDAVGEPVDKPADCHVIKRGKTITGQQIEVDKNSLIQALAKDDYSVQKAAEVLGKNSKKN